jgi:hypothetical protein
VGGGDHGIGGPIAVDDRGLGQGGGSDDREDEGKRSNNPGQTMRGFHRVQGRSATCVYGFFTLARYCSK